MNAETLIGTVLGTCALQRLIGQGGMGAVYLAQQSRPRRQVAVKVFLPMTPLSSDQLAAFLERFRRETDAAASLEHPNIVPVHEYGECDGIAYLVMPYISSGTLRDEMEREGPLALNKVVHYLDQMAAALDFAHERGVIHRDIKPANILMTSEGRLLLTDFGLVKIVAEGQVPQVRLTGAGTPVGTPDYMSPEQVLGADVDARADLYSLGVVLYQMVTGTTPFQGDTPMQIATQHLQIPPPSPQMLRPDLPVAAEQVILRALAKQPANRYICAKDLAEAFRVALIGTGILPSSSWTELFDSATGAQLPAAKDVFNSFGRETKRLPSIDVDYRRSTDTNASLPVASTEAAGRGLLAKTSKFPQVGSGTEGNPAMTMESTTMPMERADTSAKHAVVLSQKQMSPVLPSEQMSPAPNTDSLSAADRTGHALPTTTMKLTAPVKVVQVPVAGQPGRYVTGLLPVASPAQGTTGMSQEKVLGKRTRIVVLLLSLVLLLFATFGIAWLVRSSSNRAATLVAHTAVAGTPDFNATAIAQATVTAQANIILADSLDHNVQNWLTTPPDVYAFKDGAYHITDHGDNGRATIMQGRNFRGPLGYTLTMQEVNGDDTSVNDSFGMIVRFNQQTKGNKSVTTFYSFEVVNTKGGEYQFWKYNDGQGGSTSPWTEIWHQSSGNEFHQGHGPQSVNTFKVFSDRDEFTFTANGKKIAAVQDNSFADGTVGMIVNLNGTEVAFKNLLLTRN